MYYQQGDVIVQSVSIPTDAKVKKCDKVILAEGETTGHAHVINDVKNCTVFETSEELYIRVTKEVTLTHEEHNKIKIKPGDYVVRKVREYDHFSEEARSVKD